MNGGLSRLGQRLGNRCRLARSSGQLRGNATGTAWPEQFTLGDGSSGNLLSPGGRLGNGGGGFTGAGVNGATLVAIDGTSSWVLDSLDVCQLSGLLVVFDAAYLLTSVEIILEGIPSYLSPTLRFKDPRSALERCVKNSVLNTQLRRGSGS